jgi:hypothetical protein
MDDGIMDELLVQHAQVYARRHKLRLAERLGHGIHGIVFAARIARNRLSSRLFHDLLPHIHGGHGNHST